jgi:hypothetical protein
MFTFVVGTTMLPQRAAADEDFSVVINGRTGAALLRNDGNSTVQLDGYLLRSPGVDVFNPASWSRLDDNPATPGWSAAPGTGNRLGEANLFGSTSVTPGATLPIGSPYLPFSPSSVGELEPGLGTIEFTYSDAGGAFTGDVEFLSRNTVVLVVDPISGAVSLQNQSNFGINIDSYLVRSVSAIPVLDPTGWTPLEDSVAGWMASTGFANRIAEGNLFGSTFLAANGGSLSLGEPVDPALLDDENDLELEYTVSGLGSIVGGVLFAAAPSEVPGDYNGDGRVNAADYTVWRNHLGETFTLTNVDPGATTPNVVDQEDYSFWKLRFGATSGSGGGGGGSGQLATGAVPEPGTGLIAGVCGLCACVGRLARRERR